MAELSKITLPNGQSYNLKDANAVKRSGDTMTGTLALKGNQYYLTNDVSGLNAQNSDLIGINGLYFNDVSDGGGEGINFLRSNGNYDTLRATNGDLQIAYDRASTETGVWSKVHTLKPYGQGTTEPDIRPLVDQTRANRLAFLPADQVIIEKTTDGGTTWTDAGVSDGTKQGLFSVGGNIYIPLLNSERSTQCGLRVTITGMKYNVPQGTAETEKYNYWNSNYIISQERYFNVREWWFWLSSGGDEIRCIIECATGAKSTTWINCFNTDFGMTGWSGSDWIRAGDGKTFGGGTNQTANYWNWRLTFFSRYQNGKTAFTQTSGQSITKIRCYGDNVWGTPNSLMYIDHMYSYDANKNVTFPARVSATSFNGYTIESNVPANAKFTDTVDLGSMTGTLGLDHGGTGATSAAAARTNLGLGSAALASTAASVGNNTNLPTGAAVQSYVTGLGYLTSSSSLDATKLSGTIPTANLPSYVDDVLEYSAKSSFPATGESGKIYVDTSTNLTWRWSGSTYVEISPSLALGETSLTAYRGDMGAAAYTHAVTNKGSAFTSGLYKITTNSEGHVTAASSVTKSDITNLGIPETDTKNTAGSSNINGKKLFLIGSTAQAASAQTYSQDTAYVGTDGKLYSNDKVVLTGGRNSSSAVTFSPSTTSVYSMSSTGSVTEGTKASFTRGTFSQGTLPTLTLDMDATDTKQLNITFSKGTLPTHAADSFTANTPTSVTLPDRTLVTGLWKGASGTAAAQTFTGTS